jgi:hypothetical protein
MIPPSSLDISPGMGVDGSSTAAQLSHPPPIGTPKRALSPGEGLPSSPPLVRGVARLPFTARIERAQFHRARSASKKGTWPLLSSSF